MDWAKNEVIMPSKKKERKIIFCVRKIRRPGPFSGLWHCLRNPTRIWRADLAKTVSQELLHVSSREKMQPRLIQLN